MFSTFLSTKSRKSPIYLPYNASKSCFLFYPTFSPPSYLASNEIEDMTNVCTLPSLRLLDLGYNSIRHITGVQSLSRLQKLFLGRNKIETISVFSSQNVSFRDWRDFICTFSISKATEFALRAVSRRSSIFRNCIFRDGGGDEISRV